jgi:hypothetical protein
MSKPKSPKHSVVKQALIRAGRPAHVAHHVATKACGKKK